MMLHTIQQSSPNPHHKHLPAGLSESTAPQFAEVLAEVEFYILGIP
jgi:hypothetical protein